MFVTMQNIAVLVNSSENSNLKSVEPIIVAYNRVNTKTLIHTGFKLKSNPKPIKLVKK